MNTKKLFSGIFLTAVLLSACTTVEPGTVSVLVDMGEIKGAISPGTYYDGPLMDYHSFSTRTQNFDMIGTAAQNHESNGQGTVSVLTRDQLTVNIDCTIQFHLNKDHVVSIYSKFGAEYAQTVIHSPARAAIRDSAGHFIAMELVTRRENLQSTLESEIRTKIHSMLRQQGVSTNAVILDAVLIRHIDLPNTLDESIANLQRERMQTQQRQQAAQTATQEADRQAAEARGNAERNLILARAAAETRRIEAESQANANRVISASITPNLLHLRSIEAQREVLSSNQTRVVFLPPNMNMFSNIGNLVNP